MLKESPTAATGLAIAADEQASRRAAEAALIRRANWLVAAASAGAAAIGLVVLIGWIADVALLRGFIPGEPATKFCTACGLVACGLALWLRRTPAPPAGAGSRRAGQILAAAVTVSGLVGIAGWILDWEPGVERLLFPLSSAHRSPALLYPGLMSIQTAVGFGLVGLAVLLLDRPPSHPGKLCSASQLLAGAATAVALAGGFYFLLPIEESSVHLAFPTDLALLLVSFALLLARTNWGLGALLVDPDLGGWLARRLLPAAIAVPPLFKAFAWQAFTSGWLSQWKQTTGGIMAMTIALSGIVLTCAHAVAHAQRKRREATNHLEHRLQQLNEAERIATIGSWRSEVASSDLSWSDGMYRLFGLQVNTPPMPFPALCRLHSEESATRLANAFQALQENGTPFELEVQLMPSPTGVRSVRHRAEALRDPGGRIQVLRGTVHEITETVRTYGALRRSLSNLQISQEITHLGSWHLDLTENRFTWTEEALRIFGLTARTAPGPDDFLAAVLPEDREYLTRARTAITSGANYDVEYRILVGGIMKWVREKARVLAWKNGTPAEVLGTLLDVSDRITIERELLRLNRSLHAYGRSRSALIRATSEQPYLETICRIFVEDAGFRFCWVGQAEHDAAKTIRPLAQFGVDEGDLATVQPTWADTGWGRGPVGLCVRTGESQIVKNLETRDAGGDPTRNGSFLALPIRVAGEIFGVLCLYAKGTDAFNQEELILLRELASDLSYGIEALRTSAQRIKVTRELELLNTEMARRIEDRTRKIEEGLQREAETGFRIQQMLLFTPPPTDVPGLEIAALTLPSRQIDGDFYDFLHHGHDQLDIIVADVMGKGLEAALVAAAAKSNLLEALCTLTANRRNGVLPEPSEIVTLAHADMVKQLIELETFLTLTYARFDLLRGSLRLVDCGHTGTVHVRDASGEPEVIHGSNLPLGIHHGEIFDQMVVSFEPHDLFVFFSDGFTEARNAERELFGVERLLECIKANRHLAPDALVQALRAAVRSFTHSEILNDDQTCVVVRIGHVTPPLVRYSREIGSVMTSLRSAREFVRSFCQLLPGRKLTEHEVGDLELAVNETVSNIIKHAYGGRPDQLIQLEAEAFPDRIAIRLHHLGERFVAGTQAPPAFDGSRESGFGLFLTSRCVDQVQYSVDNRGRNQIDLVKLLTT